MISLLLDTLAADEYGWVLLEFQPCGKTKRSDLCDVASKEFVTLKYIFMTSSASTFTTRFFSMAYVDATYSAPLLVVRTLPAVLDSALMPFGTQTSSAVL